ncbi:hypothetical protein Hanom_Chr07g00621671 [Helianthus anomalus]
MLNFSVVDKLFLLRLGAEQTLYKYTFFRKVYLFYHLLPLIRGFYLCFNDHKLSCHSLLDRIVFITSWHE